MNAPYNPGGSNVRPNAGYGQKILVGDKVSYECLPGFSASSDSHEEIDFQLECLDHDSWEVPGSWPSCPHESGAER